MYMTVDRFKHAGLGSDLSGIEDWELASMLDRASALVDDYCVVPRLPSTHDFRGGSIVDESESWKDGQRRVFLKHRPVRTVTRFRIYATNTVYVEIQPGDIFVEEEEGWAEVVALSLTPVGFWSASHIVSLEDPIVKVNYTYGWSFSVTDERIYPTDAWQYRAMNQFWDSTVAPVVKKNGIVISAGFTIDMTEGTVTFSSAQIATDVFTVTYAYTLPKDISQATGIVTAGLIAERDLTIKGMGNLAEIQVEEVRLRRDARRTGTVVKAESIPDTAKTLLAPFRFIGVS